MFCAHAPVGYLVGIALQAGLGRWGYRLPGIVPLAVAGSLAPDLDLLLWLWDPTQHHHRWPTHWPTCWAALFIGAMAALRVRPKPWVVAIAVFAGNGFLHQVLDTLVGDIRWLAPFSDVPVSVFVVQRLTEPWWLNFLLHPTFAIELALCVLAGVVAMRRRRATGTG